MAMRTHNQPLRMLENLESRNLLSGLPFFSGGFGGGSYAGGVHISQAASQDPVIQADLATLKTDQLQLKVDLTTLSPTLSADRQAIVDAIKALAPTTDPLKDTLKADIK